MAKKKGIISAEEWENGISIPKKQSRNKMKDDYSTISNYDKSVDKFYSDYLYQTNLTNHLDNLSEIDFSQELINEIVLWKVNRYVSLKSGMLRKLDGLKTLRSGHHRQSKDVLDNLLNTHGVDLAMASTILRFRNPGVFQIIDRHAYRAVYGRKYPLYPYHSNSRKITLYFNYLDELVKIAKEINLEYEILDRLLYVFDKQLNGSL